MSEGDPDESSLTRAISVKGQTIVFRIRATGTIKQPRLWFELFSGRKLSSELTRVIVDRISFFLSLDDDLGPFYRIGREDPDFRGVIERLYGLHQVKFLRPFEAACWAVLSQHNLLAVAQRMKQELVRRFGTRLDMGNKSYLAFPEPSKLADVGRSELLPVVRNRRRAESIEMVSRAFDGVNETFLRTANYPDVENWLRGIKGIGEWSARLVLLRGLGRMDNLAVEKRLLTAASRIYGHNGTVSREKLDKLAEKYGSCKGYWAHYLRADSMLDRGTF